MTKIILCKVTSRERPDILLETVKQYIEKASDTVNMRWLFSFDENDPTCNNEQFIIKLRALIPGSERSITPRICIGTSTGKINAINRDVQTEYRSWDILFNISDDQRPIVQGYDDIIRAAMPDSLDASLWFTDGQRHLNTQEIIGRTYYNRFGYIYHPSYKSMFADNEATQVAKMLGKQIKGKQIVRHFHPGWQRPDCLPMDDLYTRNDKYWNEDEMNFKVRQANNFGLHEPVNLKHL